MLLIEDDPVAAQLARDALSHCDRISHVTVAVDGVQAMRVLRQESESPARARVRKPDAILLNLSLPDSRVLHETFMSVFGVARSTPILVIADEPDSSLETLLLREGAQDFLLKSELDAEPLARRMKHAVERQRYVNSFSMARLADAVAAPRQIALDTVPLDLIVVAEATLVE